MRALFSVSDKRGVVDFARQLRELGWEIVATGGTMKLLQDSGIEVINISQVTGFPEICDGRVKTLHPKVHGGLLAQRNNPEHLAALRSNEIEFIDLVCVNLYPFAQTIGKEGVTMEEAVENIDIGGPSMLRSAAKNWQDVTVVCNPDNYPSIIEEIRHSGNTTPQTRLRLSAEAYTHTAEYDMKIAAYMRSQAGLSEKLFLTYDLVQPLRYGENPHQSAKFYRRSAPVPYSTAFARQLNGKELSYNNIQDANAALGIVRECGGKTPKPVWCSHRQQCRRVLAEDPRSRPGKHIRRHSGYQLRNRRTDGNDDERHFSGDNNSTAFFARSSQNTVFQKEPPTARSRYDTDRRYGAKYSIRYGWAARTRRRQQDCRSSCRYVRYRYQTLCR